MIQFQSHLSSDTQCEYAPSDRFKRCWSRRSYHECLHLRRLRPHAKQVLAQRNTSKIQEAPNEQR